MSLKRLRSLLWVWFHFGPRNLLMLLASPLPPLQKKKKTKGLDAWLAYSENLLLAFVELDKKQEHEWQSQ